jgi:acyl-CoA hydrolase
LGKLRVGKIIELMDSLAADTGFLYTKDMNEANSSSYFVTAVADGLTPKRSLSTDLDLGINCYPIGASNSSLHVRADVYHEVPSSSGLTVTDPVLSAYFRVLNRNSQTHEAEPFTKPIDLQFSDGMF